MKLLLVAGARPNFMKIAPIIRALRARQTRGAFVDWSLVHTGQHYDYEMSQAFFEELEIPEPQQFLEAGSGSHAVQTAAVMVAFEQVFLAEAPDVVVVVGDVNSTLACAVTAKKLGAAVAHVEAGLRSRDLAMPEEINRMVTDAVADYLFVTEKSGRANLLQEGHGADQVFFVGNVMVDTLLHQLGRLKAEEGPRPPKGPYAVVTLHRPSNVDTPAALTDILEALKAIARDMPVFFPAHPRTRKNLEAFGLLAGLAGRNLELLPPLPYMRFLRLWKDAALVLTDSGGLQEETTALGVPCFTIRENTERPVTIEEGTNTLVGTSREGILAAYAALREGASPRGRVPELWDGKAGERIVDVLLSRRTQDSNTVRA